MTNFKYMPRPVYANGVKFDSREKADKYIDLKILEIASNVKGYQCDDCDSIFSEFETNADTPSCPMCDNVVREIQDIGKELREIHEE